MSTCRFRYWRPMTLCMALSVILLAGCPPGSEEQVPPVAAFSATPLAGAPWVVVQFSDESEAGGAGIDAWSWVFGDGGTSEEQHPSHVYTAAGRYSVGLTVRSAAGEDTHAVAELIVVLPEADVLAPQLTLVGEAAVDLECGEVWVDPGAVAVDAEEMRVVAVVVGGEVVRPGTPGVYAMTYDAADGSGNVAPQLTRVVTVRDVDPPELRLHGGDLELHCGGVYVDPGVSVTDRCDGAPVIEVSGMVEVDRPGVYPISYMARDAAGHVSAVLVRRVSVIDDAAPVITLAGGDALLDCSEAYNEAGATALDGCDGEVAIAIESDVSASGTGLYAVRYTAVDAAGNVATVERSVRRVDRVAPVITMVGGDLVVECRSGYSEPGVSAEDNCDGAVEVQVTGSVRDTQIRVNRITYDAMDRAGNAAVQQVRRVTVVDSIPPVITLRGGDMMVDRGYPFVDPGATAFDACGGGNQSVKKEGTVDTNTLGTYTVVYRARDGWGNVAEATREVTVVEACTEGTPWSRIYGGLESEEENAKVIQTRDCGYLFLFKRSYEYVYDPAQFLLKTDAVGNVLWEQEIALEPENEELSKRVVDFAELASGEIYLLIQREQSIFEMGMGAALFTADGALTQEIDYGIGDFSPESLVVTRAGVVYVAGALQSVFSPYNGQRWFGLVKLFGERQVAWVERYRSGRARDIQEAANGDLILGGELQNEDPYDSYHDPIGYGLLRVTPEGEEVWEKPLTSPSAWSIIGFAALTDGGVLAYTQAGYFKQLRPMQMLRLDSAGNELWVRDLELGVAVTTAVAAEGGSAVLGGRRIQETLTDVHGLLQKLDRDGNVVWLREYGGGRGDAFTDLIATAEGGYFAAGQTSSYATVCRADYPFQDACDDLWGMKLDGEGIAPAEPEVEDTAGWVASYGTADDVFEGITLAPQTDGSGYVAVVHPEWFPLPPRIVAIDENGRPEWQRTVDFGETFQDLWAIEPMSSGGYAVAGAVGRRMLVVRLRDDGSEVWSWRSSEAIGAWAYDLSKTRDGGLIVAGASSDATNSPGESRGYVVRLSSNGVPVWEHRFASGEQAHFAAVSYSVDERCRLLFTRKLADVYESEMQTIDGSGNLLGTISLDYYDGVRASDLFALPDGGWLIAGTAYIQEESRFVSKGWVVRLSPEGGTMWEKFYPRSLGIVQIALLPNGNILLGAGSSATTFLSEWTLDGEELWQREVPLASLSAVPGSLVATEDGIVGIGVSSYYYTGPPGAMVFKADLEGRTDREVIHHVLD